MLTTPCGDQTKLSSFVLGTFRYLPSTISCCHSTREKFTLHSSFGAGGDGLCANSASAFHGRAISTVHPVSRSPDMLRVPRMCTAVRKPGIFHSFRALPPCLYGLSRNR